jgi:hypothetical protein
LLGEIDAACERADRDPATLIRTICPLVAMEGAKGRVSADGRSATPLDGLDPVAVADELAAYADMGVGHVQIVLDPITPQAIDALAATLRILDA